MTPTAQRMRNFLLRSARFVRASFVASGLALIAACVSSGSSPGADDVGLPETFDVLALNMWHGGDAGKRPLEDTVRVLRTAAPDAVCFQEVRGLAEGRPDNAEALSARMGWSYMAFSGGRGVATRHRFAGRTRHAAIVELPSGRRVHVASVHLPAAPYQPYQLARIPYEGGRFISTEAEAIAEAKAARLANLEALLEDLEDPLDDDEPVSSPATSTNRRTSTGPRRRRARERARSRCAGRARRSSRRRGCRTRGACSIPIRSPGPATRGRPSRGPTTRRIATTASTASTIAARGCGRCA